MAATRFTALSPADIATEFSAIAGDTATVFGRLDATGLNWQPDAASWSVAQCFEHLAKTNQRMFEAIDRALDPAVAPTIWQRLPLWPRLLGWMLVRSQSPGGRQRYTAPESARPASSGITPDIIERFIACQQTGMAGLRTLDPAGARRIMVSPFAARITYRVLDGYRLIAAHQRRHFEQAVRVTGHPAFPRRR